jgi:hypothetical protein
VFPHVFILAAGPLPGTAAVTNLMDSVTSTIQTVMIPAGVLGVVWGAFAHEHVFHSPQSPQQGKDIIRYSIYGLIGGGLGPAIIRGLAGAVGAVGVLHGLHVL